MVLVALPAARRDVDDCPQPSELRFHGEEDGSLISASLVLGMGILRILS